MSRSFKKPIVKQSFKNEKKSSSYWRTIRRVIKGKVKFLSEELEEKQLPDPKEIINDYNYSDYRFDMRFDDDKELSEKYSRK